MCFQKHHNKSRMKQVTKGHKPTRNQETSESDISRLDGFIERIQPSNQMDGLYISESST